VPILGAILATAAIAQPTHAQKYSYKDLHRFAGFPTDGDHSYAGLTRDSEGKLYGTTSKGGASGYGAVFTLAANGTETVMYSFTGGADGSVPMAGLILDPEGNLYGTTQNGGASGTGGASGAGVVFELNAMGTETVLYNFTGGADGGNPEAGLLRDREGNLYGTTERGGASSAGIVFKVDATGQQTVLYAFTGGTDGGYPLAGLVGDSEGNLYGTTSGGGAGAGVVFELDSNGAETVLYRFTGGADGGSPFAGLVRDSAGNLYGTTSAYGQSTGFGYGVVFKLDTAGTETVLHAFTGGDDGALPYAGVIRDSAGNLYGTTYQGGKTNCGVVFKVDSAGTESVLHMFTGKAGGRNPAAGLLLNSKGDLYGTTVYGGTADNGVVFRLTP
jgi:uncharacterized repeat protein (TIGR03803 family)